MNISKNQYMGIIIAGIIATFIIAFWAGKNSVQPAKEQLFLGNKVTFLASKGDIDSMAKYTPDQICNEALNLQILSGQFAPLSSNYFCRATQFIAKPEGNLPNKIGVEMICSCRAMQNDWLTKMI